MTFQASEPAPPLSAPGEPRLAQLAHIAVEHKFGQAARIFINGTDLAPRTRSMTLDVEGPAVPPRLTLELLADVSLDMTGVVELLPAPGGGLASLGEAVAEWLQGVDVDAISSEVLSSGMNADPIQAVVDALRRRALGER